MNFIFMFLIMIVVVIKNIKFLSLVEFEKGMKVSYLIFIINFLHVNAISYEKSVITDFIEFHLKIHH